MAAGPPEPPSPRSPAGPAPERLALQEMIQALWVTRMVCSVAELGVADVLADGPKTAAELAAATGSKPDPLRRVMRALVGRGVFGEETGGRYVLTPLSQQLRSGPGTGRAMARFYGSEAVWDAWGQLSHALLTGGNPFQHVHGVHHFEYLAAHPADAALFNDFMTSMPLFAGALLYDFTGAKTFVDVGGGHGNGMIPVLEAYPQLRGILFELPQVAEGARAAIAKAGLGHRCDVVEGSFFEQVPAGGDVYLLSNILHDWDDESCGSILSSIHAAIPGHGKLLVVEGIVPEGNDPSPAKMLDIQMLVMLGGLQRTQAEFESLLGVNSFQLERVATAGLANLIVAAPK